MPVAVVAVALLVLSAMIASALTSCPEGFTCSWEDDAYVLLCQPIIDQLQWQKVESTIANMPPQTTRLKIRCVNDGISVRLTFANLMDIRELTLDRVKFTTSDRRFFAGVNGITHLVLRNLPMNRLDESFFEGLTNVRSLTIEHLHKLEYMHPSALTPMQSLQSLSFRDVGSIRDALRYDNFSRLLGGIVSPNFHTLVLYAIHSAQHSETQLNIDELFAYSHIGASLKHLDLGRNNLEFIRDYPQNTLPALEYFSLAENALLGSEKMTFFWINLLGHLRLKILDMSGMNSLASATSTNVLFGLAVDFECKRAFRLPIGPNLESVSLQNATFLIDTDITPDPFCLIDKHKVLRYIDLSNARCSKPLTCYIGQFHALEYFNLQNVNTGNISGHLFSKASNLTVLLLGKNNIGDAIANDTDNRLFHNNRKLRVLDLAGCQISEIPANEFSNLHKLQHLNLSGNSLRNFHVDVDNLAEIRVINLRRNKLVTLVSETRRHLDKLATERSVQVDLSQNPLQCNCNNSDFVSWTRTSSVRFLNKDDTVCIDGNDTEHSLFLFDYEALESACYPDRFTNEQMGMDDDVNAIWWYIRVLLPVAVVVFAIIIMACVLTYRYRWKCAYLWSRVTRNMTHSDVELDDAVYERDAFVCYNSNDSGWVCHDLLENLERHQISTVIHHRDFLPGSALEETINESIAKSRHTVLVLSPDFLSSNWCLLEMHLARSRIISEGRDVIVPIILREFPASLLSRTLEGILSISYLEWTDDPEGQALFWDKLTTKLKCGGNLRPLKL